MWRSPRRGASCEGPTAGDCTQPIGRMAVLREDFHIKQVSHQELWRLAYRFLGESEVEAFSVRGPDRLRIAQKRLRLVLNELKLRGTQLELDLRQTQKES